MKRKSLTVATTAFLSSLAMAAHGTTLDAVLSAQVEENEIDAFGDGLDQAFFNVQGDDDDTMNTGFLDGHAEALSQEASRQVDQWFPSGSVVLNAGATDDPNDVNGQVIR